MGRLTLFFKWIVGFWFPDPCVGDDLVFRETLVKVVNEILLRLEQSRDKLSEQDLEVIAFGLRRVYFVAQAYKDEKRKYTVTQWTKMLIEFAVAAGVPVPSVLV